MSLADAAAIRALIEHYLDCFNAADFEAALDSYHLPFTWFFGKQAVTVATREEFLTTMNRTRSGLKSDGLGKSVLNDCAVQMLGDHGALAPLSVSRLREDGSVLEVTGGSYLLHNDGGGWRLAGFISHQPYDADGDRT